jgi:hypothetical protein
MGHDGNNEQDSHSKKRCRPAGGEDRYSAERRRKQRNRREHHEPFVNVRLSPVVQTGRNQDREQDDAGERNRDHDEAQHEIEAARRLDPLSTELEEAYRSRAVRMVVIADPFFSELRSDARYRQLVTQLRLPIQP